MHKLERNFAYIVLAALMALMLVSTASAQSYTTVSATTVQDGFGAPMASGVACFYPTASDGTFTNITSSGGSAVPGPFCTTVTAGAFTLSTTPNLATAAPSGLLYTLIITKSTGVTTLTLSGLAVTGSTYNLDSLVIPTPPYPGQPSAYGLGIPYYPCLFGALYTRTDASTPATSGWRCDVNGGGTFWFQYGKGVPPPQPVTYTTATQVTLMIRTQGGGVAGVSSITPGTNVSCTPVVLGICTGAVTVNATAGGGGPSNFPGTTHQFITSYNSGTFNFASAQPAFTDISGTMAPAQCPLGSSTAFGCVKVDNISITAVGGIISAVSAPAPCPAATCVLVAPSANQTITQPTGTNLGSSHSNWGTSPVTGLSDAISASGTFSSYTGDTGGSSVSGGVNMRTDISNFTDPGWNLGAGFAYQPGSAWQVSTGHFVVTNSNSAGIKNGIYSPLVCNGEGDCNGISNSTVYHGNQTEGAGEGNTGIENQMVEGGGTSATVVTGGSKATTIVLSGGNGIGIGRLAIDTTSGGTSTTQTLGSTFGNFQIVNLGTSVAVSTCGTVAGGALIGTTQYSIASNILTVFASNSFFPSEQLTLSGYTTSSFLNGTYIIFNASSTSFQINFTHANVSLTTEAGFVNSTNVDTPRQAGAGSIAMTFGVTLGSAYSLPSPAPIATYAGPGWSDSERIVSVGSYTGGVQYLTMNLFKPISNGANFCIGGLAGYVEKNTTAGGEYYNYILGSPTTTSAYVYAMRQGSPTLQFVYAGNVTMYPAATVRSYVPGTNTVTLTDNNMASATSDNYSIPDGIIASYSFQNNNLLNLNPNAVLLGSQYRYTGSPLIFGGQMLDIYPGTPGNLISQGGTGRAPVGMLFEAVVGAGLQFRNPPSDCADGNSCNNALMNVDCEVATVTCAPTYDLWHDGNGTSRDSELLFTRASNLINFRAVAGPSAVLQVNGHQVCDSSGAGGGSCGGSGPTIQTNTVNNASQVLLNFTTSTANTVGLTATPVNTSGGIQKFEVTGSSYTGNAATASALASAPTLCTTGNAPTGILANGNATGCASISSAPSFSTITSGTNSTAAMVIGSGGSLLTSGSGSIIATNAISLSGGTLGQVPYQISTGNTNFTSAPVTSGHTFVLGWTPAGSALAPTTIDLGAQTANTLLGSLTATTPSVLAVPSCSGASNALIWTSGTGFGCNTISGGSVAWNAIGTPVGNLALTFPSANTTVLTAGSATSTANFFTLQDTTGNTGTGDLLKVGTVGTSAMQPLEVLAKGTSAFKVLATGETGATGKMFINASSNSQGSGLYVGANGSYVIGSSSFVSSNAGANAQVLNAINSGNPTIGSSISMTFQAINSSFSFKNFASITSTASNVTAGTEAGNLVFAIENAGAPTNALVLAASRKGTFTCTIGGTITISNTAELVTSDVIISLNTAGGTITTPPAMKTVTSGTGFTVLCGASDTSIYNYNILN